MSHPCTYGVAGCGCHEIFTTALEQTRMLARIHHPHSVDRPAGELPIEGCTCPVCTRYREALPPSDSGGK